MFRDGMVDSGFASKTISRRIASLSSFYKYLAAAAAAEGIREYIEKAEIKSGPLFRPQLGPKSSQLSKPSMNPATMYRVIQKYLEKLPGAMKEVQCPDGSAKRKCVYTPHSLRATTATLLLDASVDIRMVQDLLGHRHITTTQIYDKRRHPTSEIASHDVPI